MNTSTGGLIVALDVASANEAIAFARSLQGVATWLKVGLELYCKEGPAVVLALRDMGFQIMLDLKLHDIPETVARAVTSCGALGVSLLTVHASGGHKMLEAAAQAAKPFAIAVLAVTVLTSLDTDDLRADGNPLSTAQLVEKRALLALGAGCAGLVCSPLEVAALRAVIPADALLVTPGIRPANTASSSDDQKRVATPSAAVRAGANYLVVGRPIRDAGDRVAATQQILAEMKASR